MKLKIADIIDKHKGKKCIVIGHGASLNPYIKELKKYKDAGYIIIGCNNWSEFYPDCTPHYWLNANTVDNVTNQMSLINQYKPVWVYADSVDLKSKEWIDKNIEVDYLPYDQRHFGSQKCDVCDTFGCVSSLTDRLTIQEELQMYTGHNVHYSTGDTVALHSIAFGIIMGCSEIYLMGIDLDYRAGYAKNNSGRQSPDLSYFDADRYGRNIITDMLTIKESVDLIGTKIYNTNKDANWDVFKNRTLNGL